MNLKPKLKMIHLTVINLSQQKSVLQILHNSQKQPKVDVTPSPLTIMQQKQIKITKQITTVI